MVPGRYGWRHGERPKEGSFLSTLRSHNWFAKKDLDGFSNRSWLKAEGFSELMFDGRPVTGIANSWSELTNFNAHLRQVAEAVKHGGALLGRLPAGVPDHLARRGPDAAHHDAIGWAVVREPPHR